LEASDVATATCKLDWKEAYLPWDGPVIRSSDIGEFEDKILRIQITGLPLTGINTVLGPSSRIDTGKQLNVQYLSNIRYGRQRWEKRLKN